MAGSINKVILVGNLGKDPEIRRTQDGRPIANFTVATSESWRDKATGERKEKTEWQDKDGQDKYTTEVVLQGFNSQLTMLDRANGGANNEVNYDNGHAGDFGSPTSTTPRERKPVTAGGRNDLDDEIPF